VNVLTAAALVAADKPALTEDTVRPGLLGLFFFVALFVATYFLWRSMNKQLKKVDAHFEAEEPDAEHDPDHVSAQEQIAIDQAALGRVAREQAKQSDAAPSRDANGADGPS
jgi:hypothetical protein